MATGPEQPALMIISLREIVGKACPQKALSALAVVSGLYHSPLPFLPGARSFISLSAAGQQEDSPLETFTA